MSEQPSIDIRIGVLQIEQCGQIDAVSLQIGIERELLKLILERGLPKQGEHSRSIPEITSDEDQSMTNDTLAVSIASAVYEVLAQ